MNGSPEGCGLYYKLMSVGSNCNSVEFKIVSKTYAGMLFCTALHGGG